MCSSDLPRKLRVISLLAIFQVLFIFQFASSYDTTNALIRSQSKDLFLEPQVNVSNIQSVAEVIPLSVQENGTSPQQLNPDYDLEPDTNKTKRFKTAIRWLKSAIGLGPGSTETVTSESESEGEAEKTASDNDESTTGAPSSSILSKLDPFNFKGKVSSKVSGIASAAGGIYETIAGAVGIGGGGSVSGPSGSNDDEMNETPVDNTGMKDVAEDDGSGATTLILSSYYNYIYIILLAGYLSNVVRI